MALETHKCPIAGCSAACPRHHAMCLAHWRMVPKLLQVAIYGAAKRLKRRMTLEVVKDYRSALDAAIAAVSEKLEAKDTRKNTNQGNLLQE